MIASVDKVSLSHRGERVAESVRMENTETNSKLLQVSPCLSSAPEIPHRQIETTNCLPSNHSFSKEALPISFVVMMTTVFTRTKHLPLSERSASRHGNAIGAP
jgi:hypothetical protein